MQLFWTWSEKHAQRCPGNCQARRRIWRHNRKHKPSLVWRVSRKNWSRLSDINTNNKCPLTFFLYVLVMPVSPTLSVMKPLQLSSSHIVSRAFFSWSTKESNQEILVLVNMWFYFFEIVKYDSSGPIHCDLRDHENSFARNQSRPKRKWKSLTMISLSFS